MPKENLWTALVATKRRVIKREEPAGERNRREGKSGASPSYGVLVSKVSFMSRERIYERGEDWLIACPLCHGTGATGEGSFRKRCPKCDGAGKISQK